MDHNCTCMFLKWNLQISSQTNLFILIGSNVIVKVVIVEQSAVYEMCKLLLHRYIDIKQDK